jgi:hypothetical protein
MPLYDDEIKYILIHVQSTVHIIRTLLADLFTHSSNKALPIQIWSMITIQLSNFNKILKIIDLKTQQPQPSIKKAIFFFKIKSTIQNHL